MVAAIKLESVAAFVGIRTKPQKPKLPPLLPLYPQRRPRPLPFMNFSKKTAPA